VAAPWSTAHARRARRDSPIPPGWPRLEDAADGLPVAVDHIIVVAAAGIVAVRIARATKLERNRRHSTRAPPDPDDMPSYSWLPGTGLNPAHESE